MSHSKLQLNERQTADFEMIGNGGFAPLTGPQGSDDWKSVVENMTLTDGEYWPIPITLATDLDVSEGDTVELTSDEGKELGRLKVTEIFERDIEAEAEDVYLTTRQGAPRRRRPPRGGRALHRRHLRGRRAPGPRGGVHGAPALPGGVQARRSRTAAGSASSPSRPATRSTAPTST